MIKSAVQVRRFLRRSRLGPIIRPAAALFYRVLDAGGTTRDRWLRRLPWEVGYWEDWLTHEDWALRLLNPKLPLDEPFVVEALEQIPKLEVSILDLGAGPLTQLGRTYPGRTISVTAVDPLAKEYNKLLASHDVWPLVRTEEARGETLLERFAPESFDIAYCCNALDHCYDPLAVVDNLLCVVRPGGFVVLRHFEAEGKRKRYLGLHQWNLSEIDESLILWNLTSRTDLSQHVADTGHLTCQRIPSSDVGRDVIVGLIRKNADAAVRLPTG